MHVIVLKDNLGLHTEAHKKTVLFDTSSVHILSQLCTAERTVRTNWKLEKLKNWTWKSRKVFWKQK